MGKNGKNNCKNCRFSQGKTHFDMYVCHIPKGTVGKDGKVSQEYSCDTFEELKKCNFWKKEVKEKIQ